MAKQKLNRHEIEARINALQQMLTSTDYKAIKAAEGSPGDDWDEALANRKAWRKEINDLEEKLAALPEDEAEEQI